MILLVDIPIATSLYGYLAVQATWFGDDEDSVVGGTFPKGSKGQVNWLSWQLSRIRKWFWSLNIHGFLPIWTILWYIPWVTNNESIQLGESRELIIPTTILPTSWAQIFVWNSLKNSDTSDFALNILELFFPNLNLEWKDYIKDNINRTFNSYIIDYSIMPVSQIDIWGNQVDGSSQALGLRGIGIGKWERIKARTLTLRVVLESSIQVYQIIVL